MSDSPLGNQNLAYLELLYSKYLDDPNSVEPEWQSYFGEFGQNGFRGEVGPSFATASIFNPPTRRSNGRPRTADPTPPTPENEVFTGSVDPERLATLRHLAIFQAMSDEDLSWIVEIARSRVFDDGDLLCQEGHEGHELFIIIKGTVLVQREGEIIAEMSEGEVVGELAVLDSRPRVANVLARGRVETLFIYGDDFRRVLESHNKLTLNLLYVLASRVRETRSRQQRIDALIRAYRVRGHVLAKLDPLGRPIAPHPELTLEYYGLSQEDLDASFVARLGGNTMVRTLRQVLEQLQQTYCEYIGAQYMHIDDLEIQQWLRERMENPNNARILSRNDQIRILTKLTDAETFETFLQTKFIGAKRFSLEGAESMMPLLADAIEMAGEHGVEEVVIGMAHRGRLNVLANIMDKAPSLIFREFEDVDPEHYLGRGDVKYHMGYSSDYRTENGHDVHLSLCFNPSHLEAVNPVVQGRTRAKQDRRGDENHSRVLSIIVHGDAAFAGQGVVQELFNLSELPGYTTGGTVHLIVNNQIGFTTMPEQSRSAQYSTDVARMLQIPVFHVNGEHPEAVAQVIQLAMDFRETFKKDVVIDMYCYRRHGHNEGDDPTYTQPQLYDAIRQKRTVRQNYVRNLLKLGGLTQEEADDISVRSRKRLEDDLDESRRHSFEYTTVDSGRGIWSPYRGGSDGDVPEVKTSLPKTKLKKLLTNLTEVPADFTVHRKAARLLEQRREMASGERPLNWGAAEALAFASLVSGGYRLRLTGQDAERGTFGHRHSVLHDRENGTIYSPLKHVSKGQAAADIVNSPLSETAVLGFEYGYSLDCPDGLVMWEAQFGDFCNVAQVIFDQFMSSAEEKWNRLSGLCVLLPHGFEGQGPEHSSARLERFLMLAGRDNIQVVNLTTPAQLFHCLRRQVLRPSRKPLVVMSPKSLLRLPAANSSLDELASGRFQRVIPDDGFATPEKVDLALVCSGKLYYELVSQRRAQALDNVAILRLEQYYPLPRLELIDALAGYKPDVPVRWVQEEPENMGASQFMKVRIGDMLGTHPFSDLSRPESASPATGSAASHRLEQADLIQRAFRQE